MSHAWNQTALERATLLTLQVTGGISRSTASTSQHDPPENQQGKASDGGQLDLHNCIFEKKKKRKK